MTSVTAAGPSTATADAPRPAAAIRTRALHKAYPGHVALHGLDLRVEPGEVFGLLGPNGAGKTTTVKILTGLVSPTGGEAQIFGVDVADPAARQRVGYLPEMFRFQDWMTGDQLLDFHGRLIGLAPQERVEAGRRALARVGLTGRGGDRIRGYSKGMTQRLGLAQALLGDPALVLLDEPTSALDPVGRREVRDIIGGLRDDGVTVFLNSHLLSEVELVCDRVAVVDRGRVVFSGALDELTAATRTVRLTVAPLDERLFDLLRQFGEVSADHGTVTVRLAPEVDLAAVADAVVRGGWRLSAMVPAASTLEDAFLRLIAGGTE